VLSELLLLAVLAGLVLQAAFAQDLWFITEAGAVALAIVDLPVLVVLVEEEPVKVLVVHQLPAQQTQAAAVVELSQTTLPQQAVAVLLSFAR
jgi:hypothetical protein